MTNWQLIITLSTLVFAIFGANWLNLRQTEKLIDELGRRFDAKFDGLRAELSQKMDGLRAELSQKMDGLRAEMKAENNSLSQKVDRIDRQLEALFNPTLPRG